MSNWLYSPLSKFYYDKDFSSLLVYSDIGSIADNINNLYKNRLKTTIVGIRDHIDINIESVFYHQNDRIKLLNEKKSPYIVVKVIEPKKDDGYTQTHLDQIRIKSIDPLYSNNDFYENEGANFYKVTFFISAIASEYRLYARLCNAIKELVFPERHGQRIIPIYYKDNILYNRYLTILDESYSEDFSNNYFQYDISYEFLVPLYTNVWRVVPSIDTITFRVHSIDDQIVDVSIPND